MSKEQQILIDSARALQLGPDLSLVGVRNKRFVQRIQTLTDKLAEVTNALEAEVNKNERT
jgi:hypothetical protein